MPIGSGVTVVGARESAGLLRQFAAASRNADKAPVKVGSPLNYAYGIETGFTKKSHRLARKAGGAFMLTQALQHERPDIPKAVAKGLEDGPQGVLKALIRKGFDVERGAKAIVPVVSHTLQRSIQTIYPGRPVQDVAPAGRRNVRRLRRPR
jgi:hypothetical protein